ncbi:MAG: PmoA family protein [Chloroflexota bacterium]
MTAAPTLQIQAGEHDRHECPVWLPRPPGCPDAPLWLVAEGGSARIPAQRIDDRLLFILDHLERGKAREFRIESGAPHDEVVRLTERQGAVDLTIDGAPFTTYRFGDDEARPFFFPLHGPTGVKMTRAFPMEKDVPNESTDHPHHRSLYVAFGEVNGVDVWAEPPNPNTGRIVHHDWESIVAGPAAADLRERLRWVDGAGNGLLEERRHLTIYGTTTARLLDLEIVLTPSRVAVLFGDTKEGGPLALRINSTIEGKRGGLIQNADGGRREAETWGKRSPWVDYSGMVDGATVGVAILDHPTSFRHPTYWHVRDYGLFAANPFGISAFTNDPTRRGDVVLTPGQTLTFRYRVCLHQGDAEVSRIGDRYHDFAHPPRASWE